MNSASARNVSPLVRRTLLIVGSLLVGCGSPSRPHSAAGTDAPISDINFADFALHEVDRRWAKVSVDCAQAVVLEVDAKGYRWGEAIWIFARGDHAIAGAKWKTFEWRVDASGTIRLDPGGWIL